MSCVRTISLLWVCLSATECIASGRHSSCRSAAAPSQPEQPIVEKHLETQLLDLTSRYRTEKGRRELVWDDALAEIARQHSREMALQGFISHELPSGNLNVRMVRAGYIHDAARENVATSGSITWVHNALLKSPAHEKNIVADDITRIGIGIVRAPAPYNRELYVTEIFANPRQVFPAEAIREGLLTRIDTLRQNGGGAWTSDPLLEQLASMSLNSLAYPYERQELRSLLAASVQKLQDDGRTELSRIDVNVQLVRNPGRLKIPAETSDKEAAVYGSAIRPVIDATNQPAFLVMTLVGFSGEPNLTRIASR